MGAYHDNGASIFSLGSPFRLRDSYSHLSFFIASLAGGPTNFGASVGALSGAIFGAAREVPTLILGLAGRRGKAVPIASLFSTFETGARRFNVAWIVAAALLLSLTSWLVR